MMKWKQFGEAVMSKAEKQDRSVRYIGRQIGVTHALMHRAATGEPVGTEAYIAICKWLNVHPSKFWSGDVRHTSLPE